MKSISKLLLRRRLLVRSISQHRRDNWSARGESGIASSFCLERHRLDPIRRTRRVALAASKITSGDVPGDALRLAWVFATLLPTRELATQDALEEGRLLDKSARQCPAQCSRTEGSSWSPVNKVIDSRFGYSFRSLLSYVGFVVLSSVGAHPRAKRMAPTDDRT